MYVCFAISIPGSHLENRYTRFMECIPAHLPSAAELLSLSLSTFGGSSIHIKAEVTHGAGECTNEALSVMMGGSSSCWCNLLFLKIQLWVVEGLLLNVVEFVSYLIIVCCLNETDSWCYHYHLNENLSHSPQQSKPVIWFIFSLPTLI